MDIRITRARRVFSDGKHNAFTGIAAAHGKVFIAFRSGTHHMIPDGAIKRLDGGCVVVCRQLGQDGKRHCTRTDLFWLEDGGDPRLVRTLPSGGDTSYAGWLDTGPGRAVLSYYSSHEHKMAVPHDEDDKLLKDPAHAEHSTPADIFLADVSYQ